MAARGRPKGSKDAIGGKLWQAAVRKAVMTGQNLEKLANSLVKTALDGDIAAIKEIGDRIDGKAVQSIDATVRQTITIGTVKDFGE